MRFIVELNVPDLASMSDAELDELSMKVAGETNRIRSLHMNLICEHLKRRSTQILESRVRVKYWSVKVTKVSRDEELPSMEEFLRG